jgi:hypothetical protein
MWFFALINYTFKYCHHIATWIDLIEADKLIMTDRKKRLFDACRNCDIGILVKIEEYYKIFESLL